MQLAVPRAELLFFQEEAVIHEGKCVVDIKFVLFAEYQSIRHESVEASLQGLSVDRGGKSRLGSIVKEVSCFHIGVFGGANDGRLEAIE